MENGHYKIYKDNSISGSGLKLDRAPAAHRPKPNAVKKLVLGITAMVVDGAIVAMMLTSSERDKHGWKFEEMDWYSIIVYLLIIIIPVILFLLIEPALSEVPTRRRREKWYEQEMTRRKNYARHLLGMVEGYEKKIFYTLQERYLEIPDIFLYMSRHNDGDWKNMRYANRDESDFLTVRLGVGKMDVSDHIIVPETEEPEEKEDELLWIARDVRQKFGVVNNIPQTINLCDERLIGIACDGHKNRAYDIARIIIGQLEMNEMSDRVQLAFAYDSAADADEWACYEDLYLAASEDGDSFLASNASEAKDLFDRLVDELDGRRRAGGYTGNGELAEKYRHIVLFVGDAGLLEWHPLKQYIQSGTDNMGLTVVILSDDADKIIYGTGCEILERNNFSGIHKPRTGDWTEVKFDEVTADMLRRLDKIAR